MHRDGFDVTLEFADISLGLVEAPAAFCVAPDLLKVCLRASRKGIAACHKISMTWISATGRPAFVQ
jgi:hypothetical protein